MPHDIETLAAHEAGHVVFVAASPWVTKLQVVQITPDNPEEGGRTVLQEHEGGCPENEKALEIGKGLAGPLAQVLFHDATITPEFRDRFRANLLREIAGKETLNAANVPGWSGDLKAYLGILRFPKEVGFTEEFFVIERNLRLWFDRPNVQESIERVTAALIEERELDAEAVRDLCGSLAQSDRVTNDLLSAD